MEALVIVSAVPDISPGIMGNKYCHAAVNEFVLFIVTNSPGLCQMYLLCSEPASPTFLGWGCI